jgi:hypothetical protein
MPPSVCPVCLYELNGVTNMTSRDEPAVGDFTICINCRSVLRFGLGMTLEKSSLLDVPVSVRFNFAKLLRVMETMPARPKKKGK